MIAIDEAITDLSLQLEVKRRLGKTHQADAIKMGIGGLELTSKLRAMGSRLARLPLPGETEPEPQPTRDEVTRYMNERKGGKHATN